MTQQHLAFAFALPFRVYDQAGHFGHVVFEVGYDGHAAVDHPVVLQHGEFFDVAFDDGTTAGHQRTIGLQRFDQLDNGADVIDHGRAQVVEGIFNHHGSYAVVREDFEQYRAVERVWQQVSTRDPALHGARGVRQEGERVFVERLFGQQAISRLAGEFGDDVAGLILDQAVLCQEDELFGAQRNGHAGGQIFHREVEGFAGGREAQRGKQDNGALVDDRLHRLDIDLAHGTRVQVIDAIDDAHRPRRDKIARDDPYLGVRHGRVGQALAERGLDIETDFAGSFLG